MKNLNIKLQKKQIKYKFIFKSIVFIVILEIIISASLQSILYTNSIKIEKNKKEIENYETNTISIESEISSILNLNENIDFIKEKGYTYDNACNIRD